MGRCSDRSDVPENDAAGRQRQLGQPVLAMAVNLYRFAAVSSIDTGDILLGTSSGHATSVIGQTSGGKAAIPHIRSEAHLSELQSLMRTPYAVFCLKNTPASSPPPH